MTRFQTNANNAEDNDNGTSFTLPERTNDNALRGGFQIEDPTTFSFTNAPFQFLCSDEQHNITTEAFPFDLQPLCSYGLMVPPVPRSCRSLPRYAVDLEPFSHHGRWVNVVIEAERLLRVFTPSFGTLLIYVQGFCNICGLPPRHCACDAPHVDHFWRIIGPGGVGVDRHNFNRMTTGQYHVLYAETDYPETQSGKTYVESLTKQGEIEPFVKLLEDCVALCHGFARSSSIVDITVAMTSFIRSVTGRSSVILFKGLITELSGDLKEFFVTQSEAHWIDTLSDLYENYARCKKTILSERLKKVFNHIIAHALYHKLGISIDSKLFALFEERKIRINLLECFTFVDAVCGLVVFLLKQGRQCMLLKSIEPMYISADSCSEWVVKSRNVLIQFESSCNPEAVNTTIFQMVSDLETCIKEGQCLTKYSSENPLGRNLVNKLVSDMIIAQNRYLVSVAGSALRRVPFGICIFGSPGIGKTSIMDMLINLDCSIRKRNSDRRFLYFHPADSEHFDGFRSYHHTMIFDDVGQHSPSKIQGVDPTCGYFIRAINNTAWCPPQAHLENKGTTPVMSELVVCTTNILNMNIPIYYQATLAPMRRFPLHIEPIVKEDYRKNFSKMLDPEKGNGDLYEDKWDFIIREPVACGKFKGEFRQVCVLHTLHELFEYYKKACITHHLNQDRMLQRCADFTEGVSCEGCFLPAKMCECIKEEETQSNYVDKNPEPAPRVINLEEELPDTSGDEDHFNTKFRSGRFVHMNLMKEKDPWRKEIDCSNRPVRNLNNFIHSKILKKLQKISPRFYTQYDMLGLTKSMYLGYTDEEIVEDCKNFSKFFEGKTQADEVEELSDCFMHMLEQQPKWNVGKRGFVAAFIRVCVGLYFSSTMFRTSVNYFGSYGIVRRFAMPALRPHLCQRENQKIIMKEIGKNLEKKLGKSPPWCRLIVTIGSLLATIALGFTVYHAVRKEKNHVVKIEEITPTKRKTKGELIEEECGGASENTEETSEELQFGVFPKPHEEKTKQNPWVQPERTVTPIDFSPKRITEMKAFAQNLGFNVLRGHINGNDGREFVINFHMLALSNKIFISNDHSFEGKGPYDVTIEFVGKGSSCDKVRFLLDEKQLKRLPGRDLVIIRTDALPGRFKNIQNNFARNTLRGHFEGYILKRDAENNLVQHPLLGLDTSFYNGTIGGVKYNYACTLGRAKVPTKRGDSGSVWVAETGYGPVIMGLHVVKHSESLLGCTNVYLEDIEEWCQPIKATVGVLEIVEPIIQNNRSYIDYHHERSMAYHGELKGFRARPKHTVYETELANQVFGQTVGGFLVEKRLTGPVMDNWRPQQVSLKEFTTPVSNMNEVFLDKCCDVYFQHVFSQLTVEEIAMLHPYPLEVAMNGAPGIEFVDSVKKSTSMGYPWRCVKRKYLLPLESVTFQDGVTFTPEILARIESRLEQLKRGIRTHPVFVASLKDEPVSFKKFVACKTRVFFCCPADFLVLVRMCFMSFCRLVQRKPLLFGVAIGMNPHSMDWQRIFSHLSCQPAHNCVAGDHVFYDKKMQLVLLKKVMHLIIRFFEESKCVSQEELIVYYTIVEDMVNPSVDYFGMLITLAGGEVSGHQMTTVLNCLVSIVYVMYIYQIVFGVVGCFFEHVQIISLGDDHVFTVSEERKLLNHTRMQQEMKKLGLDYTMAEKEAQSVPFIMLTDAPFLKRKFVYSDTLQCIVGPIELNTVFKMLTVNTKSRSTSKPEQLAQSICAAVAEAFYHGREFFDAFVSFINSLQKSERLIYELSRYPFLDWDQYVERFHQASNSYVAIAHGPNQNVPTPDSYCFKEVSVLQSLKRMDLCVENHARAFPENRIYERMELDPKIDSLGHSDELMFVLNNNRLAQTNTNLTGNYAEDHIPDTAQESVSQEEQTTFFVNEPMTEKLDMSTKFNKVANFQKIPYSLGEFLKRPTLITTYRWTENDTPGMKLSFDPWNLYFTNTSIKNKLQGFNFIRATLNVKFLVNGSPFYYGKLGAFYRPLANQMTNTVPTSVPVALQQIAVSQRPHVWLDNQSTSNEEMTLPFLYPLPWASLRTASTMTDLGSIELWQYATLRSANGVTTNGIDITVYAYCADFELAGPTALSVLQADKEYRQDGQISGPASTVARVAGALKQVPMIGGLATATEMAANMTAGVANFFGFTNVPNVSDVNPYKNIPFQLASSSISEPVMKLSLQPKQEIAVGSDDMGGSAEDELMISKLVQRESFLCGTLWTTTANDNDTLFVGGVSPSFYAFDSSTSAVAHTPLSYWSVPFEYWRGSIIFRIKVVRSQYHRGRLNINWDVGAKVISDIPNFGDPNTMNVVLDLDQSDEVEVEIPYVQAKTFLRCGMNQSALPSWRTWENSNAASIINPIDYNGLFSVKVMNRLTAPEATSDVDVLVFVRAGKDFQFAAPVDIIQGWTHSSLRASVNQSEKVYVVGGSTNDDADLYRQVFGEHIVSLRELLHRSSLSCIYQQSYSSANAGPVNTIVPLKRYPRPPGVYNNGWEQVTIAATTQQMNFSRMSLINWVLPVFIGYKGSVNITSNVFDVVNNKFLDVIMMERAPNGPTLNTTERKPNFWSNVNSLSTSANMKLYQNQSKWNRDGLAGTAMTNARTNTGLCVNLPYYSNYLFLTTDPYVQYSNADTISGSKADWFNLRATTYQPSGNPTALLLHYIYYATGPDFDVVFNLNCPIVFYHDEAAL